MNPIIKTTNFSLIVLLVTYVLTTDSTSQQTDSPSHIKRKIEDFKIKLHDTLENLRIRRSLSSTVQDFIPHSIQARETETSSTGQSIVVWSILNLNGKEVVFAGTEEGHIALYHGSNLISLFSFPVDEPIQSLLSFQHGNRLWLIGLHRQHQNKHFLQMYECSNNTDLEDAELFKRQLIGLSGSSLVTLVNVKNRIHLVVVENGDTSSVLSIFFWTGTQFDRVLSSNLKGKSKSVAVWDWDSVLYVAVSLFDSNQLQVLQFLENQGVRSVSTLQVINGHFNFVYHFEFAGSQYLICERKNKLVLFWWNEVEFESHQEISFEDSEPVLDISILVISRGVVIVVVKPNLIEYYVQDSSVSFIKSGSTEFPESWKLKSAKVWRKDQDLHYLLPIFQDLKEVMALKLDLYFESKSLDLQTPLFSNCSMELNRIFNEINSEIEFVTSKLNKVWMKDRQNFLPALTVIGKLQTENAKISKVVFKSKGNKLNALLLLELQKKFFQKIIEINIDLNTTIRKSGYQEIKGDYNFVDSVNFSHINLNKLENNVQINGVHSQSLSSALKNKGDQTFLQRANIKNINATVVETSLLNDKKIHDYLLLKNSHQVVKGNLIFQNSITINNLNKTSFINSIKLSELVTTTSEQLISGNKQFSTLTASSIASKGLVNGVNIKELEKLVVRNEYEERLKFVSNIMTTNLTILSINDNSIEDLLLNSVKQLEDTNIRDLKTFSQPLHISDNLSVASINGINPSYLIDLPSNQSIFGQTEFINSTFTDIETDLVNGIDLSSEAITKFGYFKISNIVTFEQPLNVGTITIKDGATIDGVDVSDLGSQIMKKKQWGFFYNPLEFNNVNVVNEVVIEDRNIALLLHDLSSNVWLKTKSQNIPLGYFNTLHVKHLHLNTWNTIPLEDIILSNLNGIIDSEKVFEDVEVTSIFIGDGTTLNGFDYNSKHLMPLITGALNRFRVNDLIVEGDLYLDAINSINVSDLMLLETFQTSNGSMRFNDVYVDDLSARTLNLSSFENTSFSDYVSKAAQISNGRIRNKYFDKLIGDNLEVHGFLNGRTIYDTFNSIVTLNSYQKISAKMTFTNELKTNHLFALNLLKSVDVSNIVFKDRPQSNISKKEFHGFIRSINIEVSNDINLVNLADLKELSFYKGQNNTVQKPFKFLTNLNLSKIQVSPYSSIDGLNFDDLVRTDKDSFLENLFSSTINAQNVYISGNVNGCNLSDIYDGSGHLITQSRKQFFELNIIGNLFIKSSLNGMSEEDFERIAALLQSDVLNGTFYFDRINASHVQFPDLANGIDIEWILNDAVRQNSLKVIHGKKRFRKKFFSNSTHMNTLNITSLCGINIPTLYRKYMSKKLPQNVYLRKVPHLKVRNVAIEGVMNGLKLPDDLVLSDTDEKISAPVIWNDTTILSSDLIVEIKVDEVHLLPFINNIVYLTKPDNISSNIVFLQDVAIEGDAIIEQINNISLNEVVKKFSKALLYDSKTFQGMLAVRSNLKSGPINNVSLENLSKSICRVAQNEILPGITTFPRIRAFSLDVRLINNISLENLWNHVHDIEEYTYTSLDRLTSIINHNEETVSVIKDRKEGHFSLYGYFELQQVLNLGHTIRFLPVFEAGRFGESFALPTLQMIVWVKRNIPCSKSYKSVLMEVFPNGTLTKKEEINGRVFPFSLRILEDDVEEFRIHTDRNIRCNPDEHKPDFIKTIFVNGVESRNIIPSPPNAVLSDVKPLEMDSGVYILISYQYEGKGERLYLFQYNSLNDTWSIHQKFHMWHISCFDLIYVDDTKHHDIYLAVTGDTNAGLFLYHWDFKETKFSLKTNSLKSISSSVLWVSVEKEVFLLLTNEKTKIRNEHGSTFQYTNPVEVLTLHDDLVLNQEISVQGIHSFKSFHLAGETFVLAVSRHLQTVYVIQHKGFNGFEVIQKINAPGVLDVTIFTTSNNDLLLAISSITGHTRVLKCIMRNN